MSVDPNQPRAEEAGHPASETVAEAAVEAAANRLRNMKHRDADA